MNSKQEQLQQKRNAKLEIELAEKKRELKIEAALERVRTVAIGMKVPEDMVDVCRIISKELQGLEIKEIRSVQTAIIDQEKASYLNYESFQLTGKKTIAAVEYKKQKDVAAFVRKMLKDPNGFFTKTFKGPEIKSWMKYQADSGQFVDPHLKKVKSLHYYFYSIGPGALGVSAYAPLGKVEVDFFKRFRNAFQLAYQRFIDIEKAQAQAKEARIETALERVRAVAMAMRKPGDLAGIGETLFTALIALEFTDLRNTEIITINDLKQTLTSYYYSDYGVTGVVEVDYKTNPTVQSWVSQLKKANDAFAEIEIAEDQMKAWRKYREEVGHKPDPKLNKAKTVYYYSYSIGVGGLSISTFKPISKEQIKILERFRNVFNLSYQRYSDIAQAEAQARESQIQLALERVRARTMAMQTSEELPDAANLLFQQMQSLGMPAWSAGYCVWDEDKKAITLWMSSEGVLQPALRMPLTEDPSLIHFREAHLRGESFFVEEVGGDALKAHYKYLRTLPGVRETLDDIEEAGFPVPSFQIFHLAYFSKGFLLFITYEPVPEAHEIFKRFANVFDQTYTRFLDLKNAEAQAREGQIQLALERVRARAMAMQHSNELAETASLLFKQVSDLGIETWTSGFNIWEKDDTSFIGYNPTPTGGITAPYRIPSTEDRFFIKIYESKKRGEDLLVFDWKDDSLAETYRYMKTLPVVKDVLKSIEEAGFQLPTFQINHCTFFSHGFLLFITLKPYPEAHDIFQRFGKVFEQTYTRFLDLQKAEAQARESQIELGLERVRARAMAMQSSNELSALVDTVFKELTKLDFALTWCIINIIDESSRSNTVWAANPDINKAPESYHMLFEDYPFHHAMMKGWKERKTKYVYVLEGLEKKIYDEYLFSETEFRRTPEAAQTASRAMEKYVVSFSFSNFGGLQTVGDVPLSDANLDILSRFGKVFDLTYTRFNDLKQAEAQAREAQIELALERVRARTMAMQNSDELAELVAVLFKELTQLDFVLTSCIIWINNPELSTNTLWVTSSEMNMPARPLSITPFYHSFFKSIIHAWKAKDPKWIYTLSGEEKSSFEKEFFNDVPDLPDALKTALTVPTEAVFSASFNNFGALEVLGTQPLSDEKFNILHRFGKVFDSSYTRFNDLKQAEAQAREAQIEAALERVRSRSMGMQKSEELKEVIQVVYEQFVHLNIHVEHTGFIMDYKTRDDMHIWLADKHAVPFQVTIPYFDCAHWNSFNEAKEKGKDFFANHLSFEEKNKFYQDLFKLIPDVPEETLEYYFSCPGLAISTVLLDNVGLYIENFSGIPYTDEENATLMRFGKVFQQTYTRFLDLQKAEAQAREAKIEAALERTRTQSMIMQHSKELDDTLRVFHEQVLLLGINSAFSFLWLPDEDKDRHIFWAAWAENISSEPVVKNGSTVFKSKAIDYPLDRNDPATAQCLVDWKSDEPVHSYFVSPDEVENYFAAWQELIAEVENLKPQHFKAGLYYVEAFMKYGCFGVMVKSELQEDEKKILARFAVEFERTYTRFLDLLKAEAQARESQIQLALERVRARTMAMQRSEELPEAATVLFQQVKALGVSQWVCGFSIWEIGDKEFTWYPGSPDGEILTPCKVPLTEHPVFISFDESRRRGDELFVYEKEGEFQADHYRYMMSISGMRELLQNMLDAGLSFPTFQIDHLANFSHGNLVFITYEHFPEMHDVFKRFAKVFEQTYTRFLDLQKAEAQAREAQIEAALEKVRSRSLAMHKSDEIKDVVAMVMEKMTELNIEINGGVSLVTFTPGSKDFHHWFANPGQISAPLSMHLPYFDNLIFNDCIDAKEKEMELFAKVYSFEEKIEFFGYAFEQPEFKKNTPEHWKNWIMEQPYFGFSFAIQKNSGIFLNDYTGKLFSEKENELLKRFAKVFEQAYVRFLDLQKAEAQAREAKIEAALERVRARTMAMHKGDELQEVITLVFKQLHELGLDITSASININDKETKQLNLWIANEENAYVQLMKIPWFDNPIINLWINALKNEKPFFTGVYDRKVIQKFFRKMLSFPDFLGISEKRKKYLLSVNGYSISGAVNQYTSISINNYGSRFFTDEDNDIVIRFGKVFEQTYTRFLDLQKAEAQAREALIEAALERVRAKAMAMHQSEDLNPAVATVFDELDKLDLGMLRCGIGILYKDKRTGDVWTTAKSSKGNIVQTSGDESMDIHPLLQGAFDAWLRQGDFSYVLVGEDMVNYYRALTKTNFQLPESISVLSEKKDQKQYYYVTSFESGTLFAFRDTEFPEEAKAVMKRFANVFNLTYKRFLDIQRAEAQAKEAKIEAALERVRSKAMAMQKSEDLANAVAIVFEELDKLEMGAIRCGISIINKENRTTNIWSTTKSETGSAVQVTGDESMDIHPLLEGAYNAWLRQENFSYALQGEDLKKFYRALAATNFKLPDLSGEMQTPRQFMYVAHFPAGGLYTFRETEFSEEAKNVIGRFADVFNLTYTRFNDLKQAEAQAREARIEAAMEKVRARAMGMQKPEELIEVAQVLRKEMGLLGVEELETSSIYIHDEVSGATECWYAIQDIRDQDKKLVTDYMTIYLSDTWVGREMLKFYTSDQKQTSIVMKGENRKEWINYCAQHSKVLRGYYGDTIPERTYHLLKFSNGYMGAASPGDISAESWELLKRATTVFSLAYTRFSDLQIAEANAKEAVKQSALDRIRADTASMRTTNDLERITPLIWNELTILGIPFIRCGVFIMNDSEKVIHTFLSTPDGKAIGAFHLPYATPGNIQKVLSHWHDKKSYVDHWDESSFTEFADILVKQGALASPEQYLKTIPHGGFYLHFLPFLQGMLYVGNTTQLGEDEIKLIQSVAGAFSTAYARYEDFNKLEAAKKQVDSTLNELQATQKQLIQSEKMASLGELTAGIAHEIQNPLNFVNNFSEVSNELIDEMKDELAKGNKEDAIAIAEDVRQNLEKILNHGKRADAIVKGMLQHSRTSSGQTELTDINILADEYLRLAYHGLRAKDKTFNAKFEADLDKTIEKINVVPQDIGRVILNLINNAFYAVSEKKKLLNGTYEPEVSITTKKLNAKVEIKVRDNGNGVPQKVLDKIFQPFFTTKPTGQGTGLGLSLSYDIVKAHGGELKVETKEGEGSEFIIQLPIA
jgi:signal transduction histidine kinase